LARTYYESQQKKIYVVRRIIRQPVVSLNEQEVSAWPREAAS
jgi:hypothetical protein